MFRISLFTFVIFVALQAYVLAQFPPGFVPPLIQNGSYPLRRTNRTVPAFFTNPATSYKYGQCRARCNRRDVKTWSDDDWKLYGQLWNEANKRGYWYDIQRMHALDCNQNVDNICSFHFDKAFFPWHRFYITHVEQVLQQLDREINPGRAYYRGPFCLGYWDWGYQEPFNNNLMDDVYKYIFGPQAIGTLIGQNGDGVLRNIPDGYFKDLRIPNTSTGNLTQRSPSLGNNTWNAASITNCLSNADAEADGDASRGLSPCIELGCHNGIHGAVGGVMGNLNWSPGDPAFFLHHTMIDHIWWIWQHYNTSFYPTNPQWNDVMPQPYERWMLDDAKDYNRMCYTYAPAGTVTQRAKYHPSNGVSSNYDDLDQSYKNAVQRVMTQGQPQLIPKEVWSKTIQTHIRDQGTIDMLYASYSKGVSKAQVQYNNLTNYYYGSYTSSTGQTSVNTRVASTPTGSLQSRSSIGGAPPPSPKYPSPPQVTSWGGNTDHYNNPGPNVNVPLVINYLNFLTGSN